MQVVAICLIRNEDVFLERVLTNIFDFCDRIMIADHKSSDRSAAIGRHWANRFPKVDYHRIESPWESHQLVQKYANSPTWIFAVDGDEIYDPEGLVHLRKRIGAGEFDQYWHVYGHALHCEQIDLQTNKASGYMTPPCRSMTKLYNFNAIAAWEGPCSERLHGGRILFKDHFSEQTKFRLYETISWEESDFRCVHAVFVKRSSIQKDNLQARLTPSEKYGLPFLKKLQYYLLQPFGYEPESQYKFKHYRIGQRAEYDISPFLARKLVTHFTP